MEPVQQILDLVAALSEEQMEELQLTLNHSLPKPKKLTYVEDVKKSKISEIRICPHCGSNLIKGHGNYHGRKRFKCGMCYRTFTELTHTPISNTKYPEKWDEFIQCCTEGLSLRKIASRLNINVATAFSWRHKLMAAYVSDQTLTGIAEADETFFLYSEKGSKTVSKVRKPRKREIGRASCRERV